MKSDMSKNKLTYIFGHGRLEKIIDNNYEARDFFYSYFHFKNLNKKIEIEIGNEINVLVFQKEEIDYYVDNSREVNKLEYCFLFGLNYKINKKYSANIRATNSIIPIRKHSSGETYRFNRGQYNTTISINILYNFNNSE